MNRVSILMALIVAWLSTVVAPARAASCTMTGTVDVEPEDSYYCDTGVMGTSGCNGWKEKDDQVGGKRPAKPLEYLRVAVASVGGSIINDGFVNTSGTYTINWTQPSSCTGDVEVRIYFQRVYEFDAGISYPQNRHYRFRMVVGDDNDTKVAVYTKTLTGSTTTFDKHYTDAENPGTNTKLANIYYTANSAIKEITGWSTNLDSQFRSESYSDGGILQIRLRETGSGTGSADLSEWSVNLDNAGTYYVGAMIRHEIGHIVSGAMHQRNKNSTCNSSNFNGLSGKSALSCEWGTNAWSEGWPTFVAARSITTTDVKVWACTGWDDDNMDVCSECADDDSPEDDGDRIYDCPTSFAFTGIGDYYSSERDHCARVLTSKGCEEICTNGNSEPDDCTDEGEEKRCYQSTGGVCDDYAALGWRNVRQVARFMWDMLDTNNEGGTYPDDTDFTMSGIIGYFEAMTCTDICDGPGGGVDDCGVDNTCNEAEPPDAGGSADCTPSSASGIPMTPMTSTRDSYNMYDVAWLMPDVPTSQYDERWLNCVQEAED